MPKGHRFLAKQKGEKIYFTGKPCPSGHNEGRFTSTGSCVICIKQKCKEWKKDNKQHNRDYAMKRHWEKRDEIIEKTRQWRIKNPELAKKLTKEWHKKNPEANRKYAHIRKCRIKKTGGKYTLKEIRNLMNEQGCLCVYCKINISQKYHVDHIMPISLGGSNWIENIQLLCVDCNQSKHNKHPEIFRKEFYAKIEKQKIKNQ